MVIKQPLEKLQDAFNLIQDVIALLPLESSAYRLAQEAMNQIEGMIWDIETGEGWTDGSNCY